MFHAAIFDMDGLLFDTERLYCSVWKDVAATRGYMMDDQLFMACVGRNSADTRRIVLDSLGGNFPYDELNVLAIKEAQLRMESSGPPIKNGAVELLSFLKRNSIPIALATSTSEKSARWMIDKAGLASFFSAFAFGNEVERSKPAPDIFLLALSRLPGGSFIDALHCVVFEDSPAGISAAHEAGMKAVLVPDMVEPSEYIQSLAWRIIPSLTAALSNNLFDEFGIKSNKYAE